ncbi:MAG: YqaJ viral recombinase family protein, partial [Planctomycetes bacterium]|nr:YqaJ viral recombinase family protein [Planctomycetota bacterium]
GKDGMAEIKCPNTATHIETLLDGKIPKKYDTQMQWQMACAGRKWTDYVSFDPRMPANLQLFVKREKRVLQIQQIDNIEFAAERKQQVVKVQQVADLVVNGLFNRLLR